MVEKNSLILSRRLIRLIMLPKFYQTHLKSQLSLAEYLLLQILINVLEQKKILSEVFPIVNNYDDLGLFPDVSFFLKGVKVTKTKGLQDFDLACKWKRKILVVAPSEGWFMLTKLDSLKSAISAYKRRFYIAAELGVTPTLDKRAAETWVNAIIT
jgi:hypothetical protein